MRNPIIGNIFFRLHIIERFGTGVPRIKDAYVNSDIKPVFRITENVITTTLPIFKLHSELNEDEKDVFNLLKGKSMSSSQIAQALGFGKTKTVSILKKWSLMDM